MHLKFDGVNGKTAIKLRWRNSKHGSVSRGPGFLPTRLFTLGDQGCFSSLPLHYFLLLGNKSLFHPFCKSLLSSKIFKMCDNY